MRAAACWLKKANEIWDEKKRTLQQQLVVEGNRELSSTLSINNRWIFVQNMVPQLDGKENDGFLCQPRSRQQEWMCSPCFELKGGHWLVSPSSSLSFLIRPSHFSSSSSRTFVHAKKSVFNLQGAETLAASSP